MSSDKTETMKTSYLALVVLATGLLCVGTAGCKNDNKDKSDASVLFEETLSKAKAGDVAAIFNLGVAYDNGEGVIEDDKEAVKWHRKAAELGDAEAMFFLGVMYANGEGVIQDFKAAVKWYRKAADVGYAKAMVNLGLMYAFGKGVIEDYVQGYAWINVAAAKGQKKAAENRDKIKKTMTPEQIAEGQKRSREIMKSISKN